MRGFPFLSKKLFSLVQIRRTSSAKRRTRHQLRFEPLESRVVLSAGLGGYAADEVMFDAAPTVQANTPEIAEGGYRTSATGSDRLARTEPPRPLLPVQNAKAYVAVTVEWGNYDPAVGAQVALTNSAGRVRYGVTDRDGRCTFDKLEKGIYSVTAIRRDDRGQEYSDRTEVTLRNNRAHSTPMLRLLSVIQQPAARPTGGRGTITFTVKADRRGPAVPNAEVWLSNASGDVVAAYHTDDHGRVVLSQPAESRTGHGLVPDARYATPRPLEFVNTNRGR